MDFDDQTLEVNPAVASAMAEALSLDREMYDIQLTASIGFKNRNDRNMSICRLKKGQEATIRLNMGRHLVKLPFPRLKRRPG